MGVEKNLYSLRPVATSRVWGGSRLAQSLGIPYEGDNAGEIILAGGVPGRDTWVEELNIPLSALFARQPQLFGIRQDRFPIAINLIDARCPLSVQVHPDDAYAWRHEGCPGLAEAWVILGAGQGAQVVAGHSAPHKAAFARAVCADEWDKLLCKKEVVPGDFVYLPPGSVHAVGEDVQVFEITGPSDRVYRLHDYGRSKESRPLELAKALDVVAAPQHFTWTRPQPRRRGGNLLITEYMDSPGVFNLAALQIKGEAKWAFEDFAVCCVLAGQGGIAGRALCAGQTLLVPKDTGTVLLEGDFTMMLCGYRDT